MFYVNLSPSKQSEQRGSKFNWNKKLVYPWIWCQRIRLLVAEYCNFILLLSKTKSHFKDSLFFHYLSKVCCCLRDELVNSSLLMSCNSTYIRANKYHIAFCITSHSPWKWSKISFVFDMSCQIKTNLCTNIKSAFDYKKQLLKSANWKVLVKPFL